MRHYFLTLLSQICIQIPFIKITHSCVLTEFDPALLESFGELLKLLKVSGFLVVAVEEGAAAGLQSGGRLGGRLQSRGHRGDVGVRGWAAGGRQLLLRRGGGRLRHVRWPRRTPRAHHRLRRAALLRLLGRAVRVHLLLLLKLLQLLSCLSDGLLDLRTNTIATMRTRQNLRKV